jgi:1-acyl-sn-glycerol-3-phosphate acyltransferase
MGEETAGPKEPHVLVANHASYADSLFLTAILQPPHRFAVKAELARVPVLAAYLRRLRPLFIERFAPEASIAGVGRLREALGGGDSVIVFPEGTFTRERGLRRFHLGAFQAAVAAHASIVPVALSGTRLVLRDGQWLPRRTTLSATFGAALKSRPGEEPFAAAVRLRDEAREHILRHCGESDLTA